MNRPYINALNNMKTCLTPECGNITEGSTDFCASCNSRHRKVSKARAKAALDREAKFSKPVAPRQKVKKVSDKRKVENEEYFKLRDKFLKENPECQAGIETICTKESEDVHHMIGRGKELLNTKFWLSVCRNCHNFIGENPIEAMKRNLSFSRLQKRETI